MLVIGLTGGIASGKSTVSKELATLGLPIIDADVIAREVVNPGKPAYNAVVAAFKDDVPSLVNDDGTLNRAELGKAVFGHKQRLAKLNGIVHGAVKKEMAWQLFRLYASGYEMAVLDVPLLFEAKLNLICAVTMTVSVQRDIQLKRLLARNSELSEEDANKRIDSQLSVEERNALADRVIDNDGSLEDLKTAVLEVVEAIRPGKLWTALDLFPPFGILSACYTVLSQYLKSRSRSRNSTKRR